MSAVVCKYCGWTDTHAESCQLRDIKDLIDVASEAIPLLPAPMEQDGIAYKRYQIKSRLNEAIKRVQKWL